MYKPPDILNNIYWWRYGLITNPGLPPNNAFKYCLNTMVFVMYGGTFCHLFLSAISIDGAFPCCYLAIHLRRSYFCSCRCLLPMLPLPLFYCSYCSFSCCCSTCRSLLPLFLSLLLFSSDISLTVTFCCFSRRYILLFPLPLPFAVISV